MVDFDAESRLPLIVVVFENLPFVLSCTTQRLPQDSFPFVLSGVKVVALPFKDSRELFWVSETELDTDHAPPYSFPSCFIKIQALFWLIL
jgi:hypothetical protein